MKSDRWKQIEKLYYTASKLDVRRRAGFLDRVCAGDMELRREVASLLASAAEAGSFLATPAEELVAKTIVAEREPWPIGRQVGHYEVKSRLGTGGMGEVYLAQDKQLGRSVAIKLLPVQFAADDARLRRFARESRAVSALNHPNDSRDRASRKHPLHCHRVRSR